MSDDQYRRLAERRELVFRNLLNGVPETSVAEAFHLSVEEVMREYNFVLGKIRSYIFENAMPPIVLDTLQQARSRQNKMVLLTILDRLNLARDPMFSKIKFAKVEELIRAG